MASNIPPAIGVHQSGVRGSIPRLVLFLVAVVALLAMGWAIRPLEDGDLFTHIVLGRHLFESPVLTASESGQRVWISWLAYLVFGGGDAALGLPGIKALNLILLWGAFISAGMWCAMLLRPCSQSSQTRVVPLALGVLSAWVVSLTNVAARPQSFAYLAFAVCLLLLECGA